MCSVPALQKSFLSCQKESVWPVHKIILWGKIASGLLTKNVFDSFIQVLYFSSDSEVESNLILCNLI